MANSEKRQRQKENSRRAREERERREQAARRKRLAIRVGVASVVVVGVVALFQVLRDDDDSAETTATTDPVDTTDPTDPAAVEYPEGCTDEEPETAAGDRPTFDAPPESTIDPEATYTARIVTTCGEIVAELDATAAPVGVNNFVALARSGFYDGLQWTRAASGFVIQTGSPDNTQAGGPGYSLEAEVPEEGYPPGALAYAKTGQDPPGTAGSQFFIVSGDATTLPPDYASFGAVTEGLEVAQAIESLAPETGDGPLQLPVWIEGIEIEEGS